MPAARKISVGCVLCLLMSAAAASTQNTVRTPSVRLHHVHFLTDDVAAAMTNAVNVHGGTRTIVPGLGAGVRIVDTYLLFGRRDSPPPDRARGPASSVATTVIEAVQWLGTRGIDATISDAGTKILLATPAELTIDHIAFATSDPDSVIAVLRAGGAVEARRTGDSVFYRADAMLIEITRETELPDAFWCPMHPDIRAPYAGTCPICSMALVPIAPRRAGEYRVDVTQVPAANGRGIRALKLRIRDPDSGEDVAMFAEAHERLLHLFIIGRDLRFFAHEHPVRTHDGFQIDVNLPPGAYMLIADFLPGGGSPQMVHRAIVTPGYTASPFVPVPELSEDLSDKVIDGIRVTLAVSQAAGRPEAVLRFGFTDASSQTPVRDLQPYLGSAGHLLVVSPDLTHSVHAHPEGTIFGPEINFAVVFPDAGTYKVWIQIQRAGKVITAPFVVRMRPS